MGRARARQIGPGRWSSDRRGLRPSERAELAELDAALQASGVFGQRPTQFGQCPPPSEKCGWVSCRHHLGINVHGSLVKISHPVPDDHPSRHYLAEKLTEQERTANRLMDNAKMSAAEVAVEMGISVDEVRRLRFYARRKMSADPELDIEAMKDTCSLRVAATGAKDTAEVADLMGMRRQELRREELRALERFRQGMRSMGLRGTDEIDDETSEGGEEPPDEYW